MFSKVPNENIFANFKKTKVRAGNEQANPQRMQNNFCDTGGNSIFSFSDYTLITKF
jgi:hypothetical protein